VPYEMSCFSFFSGTLIVSLNILFLYCRVVYTARPHAPRTEKVVGIGFQPGFDPYKVTSCITMFYIFIVEATKLFSGLAFA
jgi:hypothetical protein